MSNEIPWIRETLIEKYPDLDQDGGVDLNGRGGITGSEIADTNEDHFVDDSEARNFYIANREVLNRRIPYFRWSSVLSPENPINELIYLGSRFHTSSDIQSAYEFLGQVLSNTNSLLAEKERDGELDPHWKMTQVYMTLSPLVTFEAQSSYNYIVDDSFLGNISDRIMDSDASSAVLLAVAYEKNWPVHAVHALSHTFVRWDDGNGETYNFDMMKGSGQTDDFYSRLIAPISIESGAYMANLTDSELRGAFFADVGGSLLRTGQFETVMNYSNRAIELDSKNVIAYCSRGIAYWRLNRLEEAEADFGRAVQLDPLMDFPRFQRASVELQLGHYEEALTDFDVVLSHSHENSYIAHYLRGIAYRELGRATEAANDFAVAIDGRPQLASAINYSAADAARIRQAENEIRSDQFISRGEDKFYAHNFEGALDDFMRALEADPLNISARLNIGAAKARMGRLEESVEDFTIVIESYPSYALSYLMRGRAYIQLGRNDEGMRDLEKVLELDPDNAEATQMHLRLLLGVSQ